MSSTASGVCRVTRRLKHSLQKDFTRSNTAMMQWVQRASSPNILCQRSMILPLHSSSLEERCTRSNSSLFSNLFSYFGFSKVPNTSTPITLMNDYTTRHSAARCSRINCSSWWTDTRRPVSSSKLALSLGKLQIGTAPTCAMPGLNAADIQRLYLRSVDSLRSGASTVAQQPRLQAQYRKGWQEFSNTAMVSGVDALTSLQILIM